MVITNRLIYLQLQKTGCTHIANLLCTLCAGTQMEKHSRIPEEFDINGRLIVGSVRNPWEWYVSLWGYGCGGKGGLHGRLTAGARNTHNSDFGTSAEIHSDEFKMSNEWLQLYASINNPELFRRWLYRIHDPYFRHQLGERYAETPMSISCGFYTYRYAYLYSQTLNALFAPPEFTLKKIKDIVQNNVLQFTIRNEQLAFDFTTLLKTIGTPVNGEQARLIQLMNRTNASARIKPVASYYDPATIQLIAERDAPLIEKYDYQAPRL